MAELQAFMDRLKAAQHALLDAAAGQDTLPSQGEIRRIADLENAIAAVHALIEERLARAADRLPGSTLPFAAIAPWPR